jgi:hypothetical protein
MQNYQFTLIALIDFSKLAIQAGSNTEKSVIRFDKCLLLALQRGVVKIKSGQFTFDF